MATIKVRIQGLQEAVDALDSEIITGPARNLLERTGVAVQGKAREKAPKDRGGLTDSIVYHVDPAHMPRFVEVGSNLVYARPTELGRPPGSMPPSAPLEVWAARHGMPGAGFAIALKIMAHGMEPRPYLKPALDETEPQIHKYVARMAREIEAAAGAAGGGV